MADQPPADKSSKQTRYQRVKEILSEAQGDACPSYQGYERFWELPLDKFLEVEIYGVRMIAPAGETDFCEETMTTAASHGSCCEADDVSDEAAASDEAPPASDASPASDAEPASEGGGDEEAAQNSCCGSSSQAADSSSGASSSGMERSPGRGAASGLIKGLKGQFPFDGTQFPRLPWGGTAVSSSDIQFIEQWIDDGCPPTDEVKTGRSRIEVTQPLKLARARGHEEHPLSSRTINDYRDEAGKRKIRKNIECLNEIELERFRRAIKTMRCYDPYSLYDQRSFRYWADIHANNCQHGWEQFLSWHRLYLYYFEQQLQDIDSTVTLPYWDWTQYREDVLKSINDQKQDPTKGEKPLDNGVIPKAYRCWVNEQMLRNLKGRIPDDIWGKLQKVEGKNFNSGNRLYKRARITFTGSDTDDLIMAELKKVNPLWQRNRWPGGDASIIFESYPTHEDVENVLKISNFYTFGSGPTSNHFFGALENIHNLMHNFSGGSNPNYGAQFPKEPQYGDMVSAGTTARDAIFWGHHSNVDRLWNEWQSLHPSGGPDDPTDILAPWTLDVQKTFSIGNLGYEYMKTSYLYETDNRIPITRFKSAKTSVHPAALESHRCADIRLHKVQFSTSAGAFIRVFLNEPEADKDTPTRGNDHFVAQVATFSGECIGGPGHCDVPPETRRKFDLRQRHRKTPGNFHIDATETIRKLRAQGENDFHVNLVVLDIDGTPKPNALWMDAVSLNFKD